MKDLILVGACYLDTILTVPQFPEEDSKLRATALQLRRGGNCPNTAEVLQQLLLSKDVTVVTPPLSQQQLLLQEERRRHLTLRLVSVLPRVGSSATKTIESSLEPPAASSRSPSYDSEDTRVDLYYCLYRDGHNEAASSYIIRNGATGSRTIVNYNALPEMTTTEFFRTVDDFVRAQDNLDDFGADYWWHFEGRIPETTLQCIRYLRKVLRESIISVEVEKPGREGLAELAAEADVVFYSKSWAESRGYTGPQACLEGELSNCKVASLMFCTWGSQGAGALSVPRDDYDIKKEQSAEVKEPKYYHCFPSQVSETETITAVDTIGAGDTFIAGVLYDLLVTLPNPERSRIGSRTRSSMWSPPSSPATAAATPTMRRKATKDILRFAVGLATKKVQMEGFAGLVT